MMKSLFLLSVMIFLLQSAAIAQSADSSFAVKDSVIRITPIPEIGSIEPFGDSSETISSGEITVQEYRSLYDILGREPGVFVRDIASVGQQNQLIINGIDEKNIAVMIDGIPYNDHYSGSYNLWRVPVDGIERVEFITGATSLFYDGISGGGVMNVVTKNFNNNRPITRLRYSQGVSAYSHTDAMFAQNITTGVNLSMALSHYGFGSNKENQSYRARFYNSNHDSWTFRSKLRYNISNHLNFSFAYVFDRAWTGLHGGVNYRSSPSLYDGLIATVKNFESYEKQFNNHYQFTAAYFPFEDSTMLASISLYSFDRLREYRDEENRSLPRNALFTILDFHSVGRGMKAQLLSHYSEIRILGYVDLKRVELYDIVTIGLKSEFFPGSFLTISPFASVQDYPFQFIANGGAEARITISNAWSVYGSIAQNLINDTSGPFTNVPTIDDVTPRIKETFSILETGLRFYSNGLFSAGITYQQTTQKNPIVFDTISFSGLTTGLFYYYPDQYVTDAFIANVHLIWDEFHIVGNGTYLKQPSITRSGIAITRYPEFTLNGSIYFQGLLAKEALDLKIGIRGNFYSEQTGMTPYDQYGVWIPSTVPQYGPGGSVDFFAIGKIGDAYVHLIWENLAGNQYLLAPVYPMYERNIRFGLSWEFLD